MHKAFLFCFFSCKREYRVNVFAFCFFSGGGTHTTSTAEDVYYNSSLFPCLYICTCRQSITFREGYMEVISNLEMGGVLEWKPNGISTENENICGSQRVNRLQYLLLGTRCHHWSYIFFTEDLSVQLLKSKSKDIKKIIKYINTTLTLQY